MVTPAATCRKLNQVWCPAASYWPDSPIYRDVPFDKFTE